MSPRLALPAIFLIGLTVWPSDVLALPACPGQTFYLKSGEALEIEFNRRPGCDVRFVSVERGAVDRKLFYPSGKTDDRRLTPREGDIPEAWSELPQKAYFKAAGESVIKFAGETPGLYPQTAAGASTDKTPFHQFCGGDRVELKRGERLFFRFNSQCRERVEHISMTGEVEEQVVYPSGNRGHRVLRTGMTWSYSERPQAIFWKAIVPTQVIFIAQSSPPLAAPPLPQPQVAKPALAELPVSKPEPSRPKPQVSPPPPEPSRIRAIFSRQFFTQALNFLGFVLGIVFIIWLSKKPSIEILGHWICSIERLEASPMQFYASIEEAITSRNIPAINYCRTDWREAGLFSAYREYLRVIRERHVFDICGAPYGTGFFVSWWFGEMRPSPVGPTLAAIGAGFGFYSFAVYLFGSGTGLLVTVGGFIFVFLFIGLLLKQQPGEYWTGYALVIPIVGFLLDRLFLPPTYYRIDSAIMFRESIRQSVNEVIDGMTKAKGLRGLSEDEKKPVLKEFFDRRMRW